MVGQPNRATCARIGGNVAARYVFLPIRAGPGVPNLAQMTPYSIGPATDRSGEVLSRLMPYRPLIAAILREVTGDPGAVANAGGHYSDGAVASQRWGQNI